MKKKGIIASIGCISALLISLNSKSQSAETIDTINTPYWQGMMKDRSVNFYQTKRAFDLYFSNKPKVKGTSYKIFERWAENARFQINPDGTFIPSDHLINEMKRYRSKLTIRSQNGDWKCLGPFENPTPVSQRRMLGRVADIAFHPTDPNTLYLGAPAGGFWKSTNKGSSWTSTTDNIAGFGVSTILIIPNTSGQTILVGTGDRDADNSFELGVYKSIDGGSTFTAFNTGMGLKKVNKLIINPLNPNTLFAATNGGIYRSYNQGANWALSSSANDYMDIKYCPNDTTVLYASTYSQLGGATFQRSINGGVNWSIVSSGFSTSTTRNRLSIAVTPANPNIVYVLASMGNRTSPNFNGFEGFYKSSNKGASFTLKYSSPNIMGWNTNGSGTGGQGWYDIACEASRTDSNLVVTGGINLWKTTNGGSSFTCISDWTGFSKPFVHADIHCLVRNPLNNELYIGSDGGIDYTTNEGSTYTNINSGLAISQFYNLGVSQSSKTRCITGAQDNGTSITSSSTSWTAARAGDGMQCEISNLDTGILFSSQPYGNLERSIDNGVSWKSADNGIPGAGTTGPWVTPFHLHPNLKNVMASVYQNVYISKNANTTGTITNTAATSGISATGTAIRFSNKNDSLVFVGWSDGTIRYCTNIFASPVVFTSANSSIGSASVNDIETSYFNENTIFVCLGNKVFKSTNKGVSLVDYSTGLPNITMYCIAADRNRSDALYVGTASGIYFRDSSMSGWEPFNNGLSLNASVRDIEIVSNPLKPEESKIYAATYGRGLWVSNVRKDSVAQAQKLILTASLDNIDPICSGDSVTILLKGSDSFTFDPNTSITFIDNSSVKAKPTSTTLYRIYGRNADGKTGDTFINIVVKPNPTITLTPRTKTIKKGDTLILKASGASTYEWTPEDYITSNNTNFSSLVIKPDTLVRYDVKGTGSNGCIGYAKATITVSGVLQSANVQNQTPFEDVLVFPNPTKDILNIHSKYYFNVNVQDITGKSFGGFKKTSEKFSIDASHFPVGQYILRLENEKGQSQSIKFSIER